MTVSQARVRMKPENRREQLLDLGVALLSGRPLDEISVDVLADEAGISRGLVYHYFGSLQEFHRAVVRRAADELIAITAPGDVADPLGQLTLSLAAYLDYVRDNYTGYVSLVRAAAGGDPELRAIYESARQALTDRIFEVTGPERLAQLGLRDTPLTRVMVRGWSAMVEEVVLAWVQSPRGISRRRLLAKLAEALPAVA